MGSWRIAEALFDNTLKPAMGWISVTDAPGLGLTSKSGALDHSVKP